MNKSTRTLITAAALAGLYAGAFALKASASVNSAAGTAVVADEKSKESCKGKDGCKSKDGCKGKDGCKSKDGCKAKDKKDDKKSEPAK